MCKILASSVNPNNVTVVVNSDNQMKSYNIAKGHPKFSEIRAKVTAKDGDGLEDLINVSRAITNWGNSVANLTKGHVTVENGVIKYAGQTLHNSLTNRIISMINRGDDASALISFLENVQCNPLQSARTELFDFLEGNNLPFTEDGCFLAYKRVRKDYLDIYSGSVDNKVGAKPRQDRDTCDTDRNNTCSRGLHFASLTYARDSYGSHARGDRMMVVKVNPADVVSIPVDYNNQKGRAWTYEVVGEIDMNTLFKKDVLESWSVKDSTQFVKQNKPKQRRDSKGRFI